MKTRKTSKSKPSKQKPLQPVFSAMSKSEIDTLAELLGRFKNLSFVTMTGNQAPVALTHNLALSVSKQL